MKLHFRPIEQSDYELVARWLAQPHVKQWWHDGPPTAAFVEREYASDPDTAFYIALSDGQPIGIVQSYWTDAYPEHAESVAVPKSVGVDLFIGEPDFVGKGYGTQLLRDFIVDIVKSKYSGASAIVADPTVTNLASVRAFEKAGFEKGAIVDGEDGPEQLMIFRL